MYPIRQVTWKNQLGTWGLAARNDRLIALLTPEHRRLANWTETSTELDSLFRSVVDQLEAYFAGELLSFEIPFELNGTPFQISVWQQLLLIPYGETRTYGQLAEAIGNPAASRAVGAANGRNPLSLVVPCHRVIGTGGALTGYAGGLKCKSFLLELEQATAHKTLLPLVD